MYKLIFMVIALACGSSLISKAQSTDSIKNHIDSALNILKTNSLYSKNVNWDNIYSRVNEAAKNSKTKADTFAALNIAFNALEDKHAVFYHYDNQFRVDNKSLTDRYSDSLKTEWKKGPRILAEMVGTSAYLRIPYIGSKSEKEIKAMGELMQSKIEELVKNKPKNWIIDLRLNAGGNIRPMVAGLSPFFSDGILGYYVNRIGVVQEKLLIKQGHLIVGNELPVILTNRHLELSKAKVAVLIGPGTGSSGEILASYFKQRKNTSLFGEKSAGLASVTEGFVFNNDNTYFLLTVARLSDKNGKVLPEIIEPDFEVKANDHFTSMSSDLVVQKAIGWLSRKKRQ